MLEKLENMQNMIKFNNLSKLVQNLVILAENLLTCSRKRLLNRVDRWIFYGNDQHFEGL